MKIKYTIEYYETASEEDINWAKEIGLTTHDAMITYLKVNPLTFDEFIITKSSYFRNKDVKLLDYRIEE